MGIIREVITGKSTENYSKARLECLNIAAEKLREHGFDFTVLSYNLAYFTLKVDGQEPIYYVFNSNYIYLRKKIPTLNDYYTDINVYNNNTTLYFTENSGRENGKDTYYATLYIICMETSYGDKFAYIGGNTHKRGKIAVFNVGYLHANTLRRGEITSMFVGIANSNSFNSSYAAINFNGYIALSNVGLSSSISAASSDVNGILARKIILTFDPTNGLTGEVEADYGTVDNLYHVAGVTLPLSPYTEYKINGNDYITFETGRLLAL